MSNYNYKVTCHDSRGHMKEISFFNFDKAWNCFASCVADGKNVAVYLYQMIEETWEILDEYKEEFSDLENLNKEFFIN